MFEPSPKHRMPVLVDGGRIPFRRAATDYAELSSYDLAREAIKGLLAHSDLDPAHVDRVILGSVLQNPETSNVAREAALAAGIPNTAVAHTITMACISSSQAVTQAADLIRTGQAEVVLAGGTDSLSDVPLRVSRPLRKRLFELRKAKSPLAYRQLLQGLSPSDLLPKAPAIAEYSTGETMGESADRLAAAFGVSREEQDSYALRSHRLAAEAACRGRLAREIFPLAVPPGFAPVTQDNTIREDTSLEKLAKLTPAFIKPFGTVTAGNSSPLTDGASAVLVMSAERAQALGLQARAVLRDYLFVAQDPGEELLLGPAYAIPRLLERNGMTLRDAGVLELHEAFAGQVLAVLAALNSDRFARERLGRGTRVGEVDTGKLNAWGGSISLGHPFGATGTRLVITASNRLQEEGERFALIAACAAGGLGHAMLLEHGEESS